MGALVRPSSMIGLGPNITTSALSPGMRDLQSLMCRGGAAGWAGRQSPDPPTGRQARKSRIRRARLDLAHALENDLPPLAWGSIDLMPLTDDDWANKTNILVARIRTWEDVHGVCRNPRRPQGIRRDASDSRRRHHDQ